MLSLNKTVITSPQQNGPQSIYGLEILLNEHKRATINGDINNEIAEHRLPTNHRFTGTLASVLPIVRITINESL